jgi:FMN phosphatase YigB (HAD superfamily)
VAFDSLVSLNKLYRIAILPNTDITSFSSLRARLEERLTIDKVFAGGTRADGASSLRQVINHYCRDSTGLLKSQILVISQNLFHQLAPATALGLPSMWIRSGDTVLGSEKVRKCTDARPMWTMGSFSELEVNLL